MKRTSYHNHGFTLVELLVSSVLLGVLLASLFFVYRMVASAWHKTSAQGELLGQSQVISGRVKSELEQSSPKSLTISADQRAVSFLSAVQDGNLVTNLEGKAEWQTYIIYYYSSTDQKIYRREEALSAGDPEKDSPGPIEEFGPADPLVDYLNGGRVVLENVTQAEFTSSAPNLVSFSFGTEKIRYGREDPETSELSTTVHLRN